MRYTPIQVGEKVKTPTSHKNEWNKSGSTWTHNETKWKAKKDKSGHRGPHYDISPPKGKTGDYCNVSPDGHIL